MKTFLKPLLVVVVSLCTACSSLQAAVLYDNTYQASAGWGAVDTLEISAQKFTTDGQTYDLVSATLLMQRNSGTGTAAVEIWSDQAGGPGVALVTLTSPGTYSATLENTSFTSSGFTLSPNTAYWVVLRSLSADTVFGWSYTTVDEGTGAGFSTNWNISSDGGDTWSGTEISEPNQMSINVSVVPEPSTGMLLLLGIAVAARLRRR